MFPETFSLAKTQIKIALILIIVAILALLVMPITAAPTNVTAPLTINESGEYLLANDVTDNPGNCITINASNVIFDGNGKTISGIGNNSGVYVTSRNNIKVKNLTIGNFSIGINYRYVDNSSIENCQLSENKLYGIDLVSSSNKNISVLSNFISGGQNNGIRSTYISSLEYAYRNLSFINNTITNNTEYGMSLYGGTGYLITGNEITDNRMGLLANLTSGWITGNTITDNFDYGVKAGSGIVIYNNRFNNSLNIDLPQGTNTWNITKTIGTNIIEGPYLGGNFYAKPGGDGFSQNCTSDSDGICTTSFNISTGNIDFLPLHLYSPIPTTTVPTTTVTTTATQTATVTVTPTSTVTITSTPTPTVTIPFTIPPIGGDTGYFLVHCNVESARVYFAGVNGVDIYKGNIAGGLLNVSVYITAAPLRSYKVVADGYQTFNNTIDTYPAKGQTVDLYATMIPLTPTPTVTTTGTATIIPTPTTTVTLTGTPSPTITSTLTSTITSTSTPTPTSTVTTTGNVTQTITFTPTTTVTPTLTTTTTPTSTISPDSWAGTWDTTYGSMVLVQNGVNVTGFYADQHGIIDGTVSGNELTGRWRETPSYLPPDDAGLFQFTKSLSGNAFLGNWKYGILPGSWDGEWAGYRGITPPTWIPVIDSLSPPLVQSGESGLNITVSGSRFLKTSEVQWNGVSRDTYYKSSSSVIVHINGTDISSPGTAAITVVNPGPYGGTSNTVNFPILPTPPKNFLITAIAGPGGSITPNGPVTVQQGTTRIFNITPYSDYQISDVAVDGTSVGAASSYTFANVQANHTINATFGLKTYTLNLTAGNGGSVSPSGLLTVNAHDSQTVTISSLPCYDINDVIVDGKSYGPLPVYRFSDITSNHALSVTFTRKVNTIASTSNYGGLILPLGDSKVYCGESKEFNISPSYGYITRDVTVDNVSLGNITSYRFENVTMDHSINARFEILPVGNVFVTSIPLGAHVFIDDVRRDVSGTSVTIPGLPVGEHTLRVTSPFRKEWVGKFSIIKGETTQIPPIVL